ncbi:ABC transporter ATP-binding protein [Priestia filamentosa]|uniref:ABC transporter ATP-binding protein n=1 Tax=Priestia filamentosa TaxID=1402861 RepID=UPI003982BDDD
MVNILKAEHINVSLKDKQILKDIDLSFEKGKIYGLLGPNGAGKTTLLKVLLGIFPPTSGEVLFNESNLYKNPKKDVRNSIGSIIEFPGFYDNLTLYENIVLHLKYVQKKMSKQEIYSILNTVGLYEHRDKLFSQTSLGMKQRLGIARAIAHNPSLLLLDEPTNGLDPQGIKEVREMLLKEVRDKGVTAIVSSHLLSEINLMADELIIMNGGEVIFESQFMKNDQEVFLYKMPKHISFHKDIEEQITNYRVTSNGDTHEFITTLPPDQLRDILKQNGYPAEEIETYTLSLEDLYLKLITKEKKNEFISA